MARPAGEPPADAPAATDVSEDLLIGGGRLGARMRAFDWSRSPVGPVASWPQSLRTAVSIVLDSRYPMYIAWGAEYVQFYNDAFQPILGTKHPAALGSSSRETWAEIWEEFVGPLFRKARSLGEATYLEDALVPLDRYGFTEECYFTFSYSPIREESGAVGGVLVTCIETTGRVIGERRLRMLRELSARGSEAATPAEACTSAAAVLATNPHDLPVAAIYLLDESGGARLAGAAGLEPPHPALRPEVELASDAPDAWPLARMLATGRTVVVEDLGTRFPPLTGGPWPEAPQRGVVVPVPGAGPKGLAACLVAGVSARRSLDDDYRGFLELVADHLARAIASARAHEEERRRAEALAELDRAKTAFFSNVSHEFRTPLTLLLGPLEDALADPRSGLEPGQRELLEIAHRNALRLLRLVNTLLDFSRIEAGRLQAVFEPADLGALTAELASGFRAAVERAGLELVVACPPLEEPVHIDRDMWEKILLNLLSNAFKHTFEGRIAVEVRRQTEAAELVVADTGVGIPAEHLPHIFERFHRVEGTRSRTHEGTGIGLALVQELVRQHGGTIEVESQEDRGSRFTVRIPFGTAHLPRERLEAKRELASTALGAAPFVEEALRWLPDIDFVGDAGAVAARATAAPEPPAAGEATRAAGQTARILVADDNADMRGYIARVLADRGCAVEAVGDGRSALDRVLEEPPDLVLTDLMMPEMDGLALLRSLRADPRTRTLPVVILSARAGEESRLEGLDAGADDYLVKPFSASELVSRVNAHLSLARLRREAEVEKARLYEQERRARADAEAARAEAEHANRAKTDFLTSMSHELRTPLNAIAGYVDLLDLEIRGPVTPEQRADLHRIQRSQQHLLALINDILNFAKLEAGQVEFRLATVLLDPLLHDLESLIAPQVRAKQLAYEFTGCDPALAVCADEEKLCQIVLNLLSNAVKFTDPGGRITLECSATRKSVALRVRDTGCGIPPEQLKRIFEPFVQIDRSLTLPAQQGVGLGLAISCDLARGMGGNLEVRSTPGHGSVFTLTLPRATA